MSFTAFKEACDTIGLVVEQRSYFSFRQEGDSAAAAPAAAAAASHPADDDDDDEGLPRPITSSPASEGRAPHRPVPVLPRTIGRHGGILST